MTFSFVCKGGEGIYIDGRETDRKLLIGKRERLETRDKEGKTAGYNRTGVVVSKATGKGEMA